MRLYALMIALAATACGGSSSRDEPGAASGGSGSSAGSDSSGGSAGSSGGAGGGGGGAGSGGGAGQPPDDDRLQPLEVGRRWSYTRTAIDPDQLSMNCLEPLESFVAELVVVNGETGYDYRPTCLPDLSVYMFITGDDIVALLSSDQSRAQYAKAPVEDGFSWDDNGLVVYAWQDEGSVQVPAGTFDRCWRRVPVDYPENYIVLCRGAGLVVSHNVEQGYRLELAGKNF